jgi:hypothetical protein
MAEDTKKTDPADLDDWFDLDKYKKAAGVAYEFSKKKLEDAGREERKSAAQRQEFSARDEERDRKQASKAYSY